MIRIAATADLHFDVHSRGRLSAVYSELQGHADLLLIGGDLTQSGALEEARVLADDLGEAPLPVVTVLGNHDYHQDTQGRIREILEDAGVRVLEGDSAVFQIRHYSVGVAGLKGFGGGFFGACVTEFGEPEMKAFARHARLQASLLKQALRSLNTDFRFALTHFSPIEATLLGEPPEIYPFLGSYLLGEVIDSCGVQGAFHGHAHAGTERGMTQGGVPVRNVAQPVIGHTCNIYSFEAPGVRGMVSDHDLPPRPYA